jgi:hypothetical protein
LVRHFRYFGNLSNQQSSRPDYRPALFRWKSLPPSHRGEEPNRTRTLERIRLDPRHRALVILSDKTVSEREFGSWAMAERRPGEDIWAFLAQVSRLAAAASPDVRATFEGHAGIRNAS